MKSAFILVMTISGYTPNGNISIPVRQDFQTRPDCVAYADEQLQAARRVMKGPLNAQVFAFCELRSAEK